MNFAVRITAVDHTGEVKQLCAIVQLAPKTVLEPLLCRAQCALLLEQIQMGQDTEDIAGHTAGSQNVQELHCLHLITIVGIDHEKHNIRNLGHIDHAREGFRRTLEESESPLLGRNNGQWALRRAEGLLRITADQGFNEGGFADLTTKPNCQKLCHLILAKDTGNDIHLEVQPPRQQLGAPLQASDPREAHVAVFLLSINATEQISIPMSRDQSQKYIHGEKPYIMRSSRLLVSLSWIRKCKRFRVWPCR